MKRLMSLSLILALLALPAVAEGEEGNDALKRQAEVSIKIFRKEFKHPSVGRKMTALLDLHRVQHELVVDELGKRALVDRNPEVRDATAQLLGDMTVCPEKIGEYLKKNLEKNEDFPEVQVSIIRAIGKQKYKDALEELKEAAKNLNSPKYQWVTVEVVRTFGILEDGRSLPFLLWMAEYGGHALSWSTGEVNVDTGASGTADQDAAEAAWKAKYGGVRPKKPPAPVIRTYMQELEKTVKTITGQVFTNATEFRKWLIANAEKFGLDPRKLSK
jgi:hypothetical protein